MTLPVRGSRRPRRPRVARVSARRRSTRILALVVLVAAAASLYGVSVSEAFALRSDGFEVSGARLTGSDAVRAAAERGGGGPGANLFALRTDAVAAQLEGLPAVAEAGVRVALPDRLILELREREPILVWVVGTRRLLVDVEGFLFAEDRGTGAALPAVGDARAASAALAVGGRLEPVDLAVARQLGAIRPAQLGSSAGSLVLAISDSEGYTMDAAPGLWHAVFGIYTATLRPPTLVPQQVQCLTSLLAGREPRVATVYLAPAGERCGTFVQRPAPAP